MYRLCRTRIQLLPKSMIIGSQELILTKGKCNDLRINEVIVPTDGLSLSLQILLLMHLSLHYSLPHTR